MQPQFQEEPPLQFFSWLSSTVLLLAYELQLNTLPPPTHAKTGKVKEEVEFGANRVANILRPHPIIMPEARDQEPIYGANIK